MGERLAEVEEAFAGLRWPLSEDGPHSQSRIARLLASLEAAALIAGVPRAILVCYIAICRHCEDAHRISHETDLLSRQVAGGLVTMPVSSMAARKMLLRVCK